MSDITQLRFFIENYQVINTITPEAAVKKFGFWLDPAETRVIDGIKCYRAILPSQSGYNGKGFPASVDLLGKKGGFACSYQTPISKHINPGEIMENANLDELDDLSWQNVRDEWSGGAKKVASGVKSGANKVKQAGSSISGKVKNYFSKDARTDRLRKKLDKVRSKKNTKNTKYTNRMNKLQTKISNLRGTSASPSQIASSSKKPVKTVKPQQSKTPTNKKTAV